MEPAKLIWDEYKYRHEHCWKLIIQITVAVVVVSIIPYSQVHIGEKLKEWIVLLPSVGFALTVLGLVRLNREMKILEILRSKHRELQSASHGVKYDDDDSWFATHVHIYLVSILLLEVVNIIVLLRWWV